jgi:hypothetical protein
MDVTLMAPVGPKGQDRLEGVEVLAALVCTRRSG